MDKNSAGSLNGFSFDVIKTSGTHGALRLCAGSSCFTAMRLLTVGLWYHVAVSFEVGVNGIKFYINGKYCSDSSSTGKNFF